MYKSLGARSLINFIPCLKSGSAQFINAPPLLTCPLMVHLAETGPEVGVEWDCMLNDILCRDGGWVVPTVGADGP